MNTAGHWVADTNTWDGGLPGLGGATTVGVEIGANDQIVGSSALSSGRIHAFRGTSAGLTDLGALPGGDACLASGKISWADGINAGNVVVGSSLASSSTCKPLPVRWSAAGAPTVLPLLAGGTSGGARGINDNGLVTGWSDDAAGNHHIVTWDAANVITDLSGGSSFTNSEGNAINATGDIVGKAWSSTGGTVAILSTANPELFGFLASYEQAVLADHPVGYWPVDDAASSTTAVDATGNGHDAAAALTTFEQAGLVNAGRSGGRDAGTAAKLDPNGSLAVPGSAVVHPNNFTFELWIGKGASYLTASQVTDLANLGGALWVGNLGAAPGCQFRFNLVGAQLNGDCAGAVDGSTHHVLFTKNATEAVFYLDSVKVWSAPTSGRASSYTSTSAPLVLFKPPPGQASIVDAIAWYDYGLAADRATTHYFASPRGQKMKSAGSENTTGGQAADPVDTVTGNFTHNAGLVGYPGSVYGMAIDRTYNAIDDQSQPTSGLGLGQAWSSSLETSLTKLGDGSLLFRGPEGRRVRLTSNGTNSWAAPELTIGSVVFDPAEADANAKYALQFASGERWQFDSNGLLRSMCQGIVTAKCGPTGTNGQGQYVEVQRDGAGKVTKLKSSLGYTLNFTYGSAAPLTGRLIKLTADDNGDNVANDATDRVIDLGYDASGRLTSVSAPHYPTTDGKWPVELYGFDPVTGLIASVKMRNSDEADTAAIQIVANTYDAASLRVTNQVTKTGNSIDFTYDDPAMSLTIKDAANNESTTFTHDPNGRLVDKKDTSGKSVVRKWDANARTTDVKDRMNVDYGFTYDAIGRQTQRVTPDPDSGLLPARTGGAGSPFPDPLPAGGWGLESFTYVGANDIRIDSIKDALGNVTKYEYDAGSFIAKKTTVGFGSAKPIVILTESSNNRVDATQDGDGVTSCTWYNPAGLVTEQVTLLVPATVGQTLTQSCNAHRNDWNSAATQLNIARTSFTYTALGQVKTLTAPEQQAPTGPIASTTYDYYGWGPQKSVTDVFGKSRSVTYSSIGEIATSKDELGKVSSTQHTFNQAAFWCASAGAGCSIFKVIGPMHGQFISGTSGPTIDQVTTQFFDVAGNLRETRDPASKNGDPRPATVYTYGPLGRVDTVTDPLGVVTKYGYNDNGEVTATVRGTNAGDVNATQTVMYDKLGRAKQTLAPHNGTARVSTTIKYDKVNRVIEQTVAAGTADESKTTSTYLPNGLLDKTAVIRSDAPHLANTEASVVRTYTPGGRVQCLDARVQEARSGQAETHLYQGTFYDDAGRPRLTTAPIGNAVTSCLDHVTPSTNNGRTYYQPDTSYWAVSATSYRRDGTAAGKQSPTQYALHHPASPWLAPDNHVNYQTTYQYDKASRVSGTQMPSPVDPAQTVTAFTCYTARGEVDLTATAAGEVTKYAYFDSPGVVKSVIDPMGMTFNAATPCTSAAVAGGKRGQTDFTVDGRGNRLSRKVWNDGLSAQISESWTYDADNHPLVYADLLGRQTTSTYTVTGGLLTGRTTTTGDKADPTGSSLRKTTETFFKSGDTNTITANQYAADGTTVSASYVTGFTYDNAGRRKTVVENPGAGQKVTTFSYNSSGQVTNVATPDTKSTPAQWDLIGNQTQINYPNATPFRFTYDPGLRLSSAQVFAFGVWTSLATYIYNANGQLTNETAGGNTRAWTVDGQNGKVTKFDQFVSSTTSRWDITYDAAARVKTECKYSGATCGTSPKTTYTYDKGGQLLTGTVANAVAGQPASWTFTYGNRGNRLTQAVATQGGATASTTYVWDDGVQLTSSTGSDAATYTYDRAGRRMSVTRGAGLSATTGYDARGKAKTITTTGSGNPITENRTYDGLGQLQSQSLTQSGSPNHTTTYSWDDTGRLGTPQVLEYTFDGTNRRNNYGNARISDTGTYFAYDYLGSTIASTGVSAPAAYDPSGKPIGGFGSYATYNYNSYRGELTLGSLVHLRARDYDPVAGVFTTVDPLEGTLGRTTLVNPYHYAHNSPINGTDPTGLKSTDQDFKDAQAKLCTDGDVYVPYDGSVGVCKPGPQKQLENYLDQLYYEYMVALDQSSHLSPWGRCLKAGGDRFNAPTGQCGRLIANEDWTYGKCGSGVLSTLWGMTVPGMAMNTGESLASGGGGGSIDPISMIPFVGSIKQFATASDASELCGAGATLAVELVSAKAMKGAGRASRVGSSETASAFSNLGEGFSARNARSLSSFNEGATFSGVYNAETRQFLAYPSGETVLASGELPNNLVPRRGGHAQVNAQFTQLTRTSPRSSLAFTMKIDADGILVEWFSRGVNGRNPSFVGEYVPENMRQSIMDDLAEATGLNVRSA